MTDASEYVNKILEGPPDLPPSHDYDVQRYIKQLEPEEVKYAYERQELAKRGFIKRTGDHIAANSLSTNYWIHVSDNDDWITSPIGGKWSLSHSVHNAHSQYFCDMPFDHVLIEFDSWKARVNEAVDPINTDDSINPQHYIDWLAKKNSLGKLENIRFGFAIITTDDYTLKINAAERDIDLNDETILDTIQDDCRQIEFNAMRLLNDAGFVTRSEGHSNDAFVGSMWVAYWKDPEPATVDLLKRWSKLDEPLRTSNGTMDWLGADARSKLFNDVSPYGQSLIDVGIELLEKDRVREWFGTNIVESAEDVNPWHYINDLPDVNAPLDDFTRGYIHCMLWDTEVEYAERNEPLEKNYTIADISPRFMLQIRADCARFQHENAADLAQATADAEAGWTAMQRAGHDFYMARNEHGIGFWGTYDGVPYPDDVSDRLTAAAEKYGQFHAYVSYDAGPNGEIHATQESDAGHVNPQHYINQVYLPLCPRCQANLSEPASVIRNFYFPTTIPSDRNVEVEGHLAETGFVMDEEPCMDITGRTVDWTFCAQCSCDLKKILKDIHESEESPEQFLRRFIAQRPDSYCRLCLADLTEPHSVYRQYVAKDFDGDVVIEGHYKNGYFEPDKEPPCSLARYDLRDDSDSCVACHSQNLHETKEKPEMPAYNAAADLARYVDDISAWKVTLLDLGFREKRIEYSTENISVMIKTRRNRQVVVWPPSKILHNDQECTVRLDQLNRRSRGTALWSSVKVADLARVVKEMLLIESAPPARAENLQKEADNIVNLLVEN